MQINEQMRLITLDIKDKYVNLPVQGIIRTPKVWLNKNIKDKELIKQTFYLLQTIMKQNYFQCNERLFQSEKGIAMGFPISSIMAEVFLQYIEEAHVKQWLDSKEIIYYKKYVDDFIIICDESKTNEKIILHEINKIDKVLQLKMSTEENKTKIIWTFLYIETKTTWT